MEKSVGKGADSPEVKKMAFNSVYLSLQYLLLHFTNNHIPVQSHQNPLLRCMNQHFGMYSSRCGGQAPQWKRCRDLESRCESGQGQSKWGSGENCIILYMNLQNPSIFLLLGNVTCGCAEHNYHQAQSVAFFLPLGVSTDIVPISDMAERMHPNCPRGNTQNFPSGSSSLSRDAGAVLDLLIPHWGVQCHNPCLSWGHVNELKCSSTSMSACLCPLPCMSFRESKMSVFLLNMSSCSTMPGCHAM